MAVLRDAVAAGVNHIDTRLLRKNVTNQIIKQALHPYPAELVIVTKRDVRLRATASIASAIASSDQVLGGDQEYSCVNAMTLDARDAKYHPSLR
jgi:pyridoxine 4-dehydrogenase